MGDTAPSDEEAQQYILNFASSLNDPNLKVAPSLHVMPSMTTLTPHYDVSFLLLDMQFNAYRNDGNTGTVSNACHESVCGVSCTFVPFMPDDDRVCVCSSKGWQRYDVEYMKCKQSITCKAPDRSLRTSNMSAVCCILPCLCSQEDVIYALNESDAWTDITAYNRGLNEQYRFTLPADTAKLSHRDKVTYLMNADDSPTPTMTYLRSVYCR